MPLLYSTYRGLEDDPDIIITLAIMCALALALLIWVITRR